MNKYLIVSSTAGGRKNLFDILSAYDNVEIDIVKDADRARDKLLNTDYDIVVINAPLCDENGVKLSKDIAAKNKASVLLIVDVKSHDEIQSLVEPLGIYVISKPINRQLFFNAVKFVNISRKKQSMLFKQLEDIRIIDRAKCCLIEYLRMTENAAHKHIEKQAMDLRQTKRAVAEDILKTYEM